MKAHLPGEALLHPLAVLTIAICAVNDHWLKHAHPSWLTGKLSDVAGLVFFPLLVQALVELAVAATPRGRWQSASGPALMAALAMTGVCFAAINTSDLAAASYVIVASEVRSAIALLWAAGPVAVRVTSDAEDLLALPALVVPLLIGLRRAAEISGSHAGCRGRFPSPNTS